MKQTKVRAVAGIQARMSSTRLPGKVLMDLEGGSLLQRVVERVGRCREVAEVFVLTSTEPSDDPLEEECERLGVECLRGPLEDVRMRYLMLAAEQDPDFVVRVTGDCPLIEPGFIDLQIEALGSFDADFVRLSGNERGGLDGTLAGAGVFSARALYRSVESEDPRDAEHVGSFFFKRFADEFRHVALSVDTGYDRPGLRLCVDEERDLTFVRSVFAHFKDAPFTTLEAIKWLDERPEVRSLHAGVRESEDNQAFRRLLQSIRPRVVGSFPEESR